LSSAEKIKEAAPRPESFIAAMIHKVENRLACSSATASTSGT